MPAGPALAPQMAPSTSTPGTNDRPATSPAAISRDRGHHPSPSASPLDLERRGLGSGVRLRSVRRGLMDSALNPLRGERQLGDARADRGMDRVGNHRAARNDWRLADRLGAVRPDRGWHLDQNGLELGHLDRLGDGVVHQAGGDRRARIVVDDFLVHAPADALRATTVDLGFDQSRIDGAPDVLDDHIAQRYHATSLAIDPHAGDVHATARATLRHRRLALANDWLVPGPERSAELVDFFQRLHLPGHALDAHFAVDHLEVVDPRFELG